MRHFLLLPLLFLATPALADTAKAGFARMNACVKSGKLENCREDITADSVPTYDRFTQYGLVRCLPVNAKYLSEEKIPGHIIVRAATQEQGQDRGLKLVFTQEEDKWKLDIPESLHQWLGEKWSERMDMAEQLYLLMRQQFGDTLDCQSAKALVNPK